MSEHPILFSAPMIQALLAGRKSVTRRMSKRWLRVNAGDRLWVRETWRPYCWREDGPITVQFQADGSRMADTHDESQPGDYEGWYERIAIQATHECARAGLPQDGEGCYVWPNMECPLRWRPSIHMPRWCSRITLEATEDARLERLQDITEEEAEREGVERLDEFMALWSTLHTKPGERLEDNPELVRIAFRRIA